MSREKDRKAKARRNSARFRERKAGNTQRPVSRASAPSPSPPAKHPLEPRRGTSARPPTWRTWKSYQCHAPEDADPRRPHTVAEATLGNAGGASGTSPTLSRDQASLLPGTHLQKRTHTSPKSLHYPGHPPPRNHRTPIGSRTHGPRGVPRAGLRGNADGQTQTRSSVAASHRPAWIKRSQTPELVLGFHVNKCQRRARLAQQVQCESSG